jgi:hypothetical protein
MESERGKTEDPDHSLELQQLLDVTDDVSKAVNREDKRSRR